MSLQVYYTHDYNELEMKDAATDFVCVIFTFLNVKLRPNYIQLLNLQLFNNIFISQNIFKIAVVYAQKPRTLKLNAWLSDNICRISKNPSSLFPEEFHLQFELPSGTKTREAFQLSGFGFLESVIE